MSLVSTPPWAARVLVADDDPQMRALLVEVLEEAGCSVCHVGDGASALLELGRDRALCEYELVITDHFMPGLTGVELIRSLRRWDRVPVILISAFLDPEVARQAVGNTNVAVLAKPFPIDRLMGLVRSLIGPL